MFDPKDIDIELTKKQLKDMGIDMATLEQAAKVMMDIPGLREIFENQPLKKGTKGNVDKLYEETKDIFDHKDTPDGSEK